MRLLPYGPTAWLATDVDDPLAWAAGVRAAGLELDEVVPAESTVLVRCAREVHQALGAALTHVAPRRPEGTASTLTLDVDYCGPDLADVAAMSGLDPDEVVARHTAAAYTVAFCGFSPGFAYLRGLPRELQLPRRDVPRTAVPAGSVAIAAHYSAVYPSPTPGGWHLLGRTEHTIWDPRRADPALLVPGTVVRFRAV